MKKVTQRISNLRCVFSGKADSLPCEARKENPIFYNQRSVFVFGFDYQSYHLPFNSTISLLSPTLVATPLQWSAIGQETVLFRIFPKYKILG